ncbi:MAG: hypothetical protein A3K61_05220 [Thaumarchaeota archaeon RBG_16_49_8]|nr:MAG: hypothetical protein A3K61_05220 [Thaumarchaeota archaeon RBG_16_49_8]
MKAEFTLIFRDAQAAEAVYRSLEPDNIGFPKGMSFESKRSGSRMTFTIVSSEGDPLSFMSTLDDIIESARLSLDTLQQLEDE